MLWRASLTQISMQNIRIGALGNAIIKLACTHLCYGWVEGAFQTLRTNALDNSLDTLQGSAQSDLLHLKRISTVDSPYRYR